MRGKQAAADIDICTYMNIKSFKSLEFVLVSYQPSERRQYDSITQVVSTFILYTYRMKRRGIDIRLNICTTIKCEGKIFKENIAFTS